jgi:hypothetical protein
MKKLIFSVLTMIALSPAAFSEQTTATYYACQAKGWDDGRTYQSTGNDLFDTRTAICRPCLQNNSNCTTSCQQCESSTNRCRPILGKVSCR